MRKIIFITSILTFTLCLTAGKMQDNKAKENSKKTDLELVEKYWKLIELSGDPVVIEDNNAKEPHIIFKAEGNKFNGNTGCNSFFGSYKTKEPGRISFSEVGSSMKMCLEMGVTEEKFLQAIKKADSYVVANDTLSLNKARMAPLARFIAVYLK